MLPKARLRLGWDRVAKSFCDIARALLDSIHLSSLARFGDSAGSAAYGDREGGDGDSLGSAAYGDSAGSA